MTLDEAIQHSKEVAKKERDKLLKVGDEYICSECAEEHEQLAEWLEELREYKELEEQGLLLKLPCKIGDKIYNIEDGYIFECDAKSIDVRKENGEYIFCIDYEDFKLDDFNKTVFLTREEAEQELKRLENEQ